MSTLPPATFRLVLLVSCAHALVHTFELALPAVEQMIGDEFQIGRDQTGVLGTVWRLPFGLAAVLAGWLADRYGSKLMLIIYLLGCSVTAALIWWSRSVGMLFGVMFVMGCFASIYHPAGLALISRETTPRTRGHALGLHGIIGSLGIAGAPFGAMLVFQNTSMGWRDYYLVLIAPAVVIAALLVRSLLQDRTARLRAITGDEDDTPTNEAASFNAPPATVDQPATRRPTDEKNPHGEASSICWSVYLRVVGAGALSGCVYAGFMHFLPRYLDDAGLRPDSQSPESFRNALAAAVLLCAAVGQWIAGRLCQPGRLEALLAIVLFANIPPLVWMAFANGPHRFYAACLLAFIHFMNQPVYNSLIAQVIPPERRSLGYGFSNMMCFGIGAFGPALAGMLAADRHVYTALAAVAAVAAVLALTVTRRSAR